MHLQVKLDPAVEIGNLGKLAVMGTGKRSAGKEIRHTVTFVLEYSILDPLAKYLRLNPVKSFDRESLLDSIFAADNGCTIDDPDDSTKHRLLFWRELEKELRDPRAYLRATAIKLAKELEELEDMELSDKEVDETQEWCYRDQYYPGQAGKEPCPHKRHKATFAE